MGTANQMEAVNRDMKGIEECLESRQGSSSVLKFTSEQEGETETS